MISVVDNARAAQTVREVLLSGQAVRLVVAGDSMAPALRAGDALRVEPVGVDEISPGDILVIDRVHDLVTHRAIFHIGSGWETKGDNRWYPDPQPGSGAIVGRVLEARRGEKSIYRRDEDYLRQGRIFAALGKVEISLYHFFMQDARHPAGARLVLRAPFALAVFPLMAAYRIVHLLWR